MEQLLPPLLASTLAVFAAVVFVAAAWHKASGIGHFRRVLRSYELFPRALLVPLAAAIPLAELLLAAALLIPETRQYGFACAAGMFAAYGLLMQYSLMRGLIVPDCGCGGAAASPPSYHLVLRNCLLAALMLAALLYGAAGAASLSPWALGLALGLAAVLSLIYYALEQLHSNHAVFLQLRAGHRSAG